MKHAAAALVTVGAQYFHVKISVFVRHRRLGNHFVESTPSRLLITDACVADRATCGAGTQQILLTTGVHSVPAAENGGRLQRVHQVLQANWTVHPKRLFDALVIGSHVERQASDAHVTVEVVVSAAHAADAAAVAVELPLRQVVVVEPTRLAEELAELRGTHAALGGDRLTILARRANDLLD